MKRLLVGAMLVVALLAGSSATASASLPAESAIAAAERTTSSAVQELLEGSSVTTEEGWLVVSLKGGPYRIGFQNGYLTAPSAHEAIVDFYGPPGQFRAYVQRVARLCIWPYVPLQYQKELRGIADGMHAAGYLQDRLWDVVALNALMDGPAYQMLLPPSDATSRAAAAKLAARLKVKGGCSAFIATGDATADGRPVMGHDTWFPYALAHTMNIMYYVDPTRGYEFTYQSFGGSIWSGLDWYENSAGLLMTETTLADSTYSLPGVPVFVRARKVAQYAATVDRAVDILMTGNNGVYSNEWLIGDASGVIASLQLGDKAYDLNMTRNGFFGSSNFVWGPNARAEQVAAGVEPQPYDPAAICYARYVRWGQLKDQHYGEIDAAVGRAMMSDTYDSYLGMEWPGIRCICGEPEFSTPDLPEADVGPTMTPSGAFDGKVCTEAMALDGLRSWACWGRGSGDHFDAAAWLDANPWWPGEWGPMGVAGLMDLSAQSTDRWVLLGDD